MNIFGNNHNFIVVSGGTTLTLKDNEESVQIGMD